jgi:tRNA (guanine-N7-)-methyltransferase
VLDTCGAGIDRTDLPPYEDGRLDPREWFAVPSRRFEIEIGSGKGTFLVQQAPLCPETNFLGIERAGDFYRYGADRLRRRGIENARFLRADGVEFIRYWCPDGVAAVIHLYFSDPWPKKRHHKRRVVQDRSLRDFHRVLTPGGELRLVTDHADLWAWYEEHAARHEDLYARHPFTAPTSAATGEVVGTNYERKFAEEGRSFSGMVLVKAGTEARRHGGTKCS